MHPIKVSLGWSRGTTFVSRMIRRIDGGYFNHVYWRFDFSDGGSLIYESHLSGGVQITPYEHLLSAKVKGTVSDVFELDMKMTADQVQTLWNACLPFHHEAYDIKRIVGYYFFIRVAKRVGHKFLKIQNNNKMTCNEFVVASGQAAEIPAFQKLDFSYTIEPLFKYFCGTPAR